MGVGGDVSHEDRLTAHGLAAVAVGDLDGRQRRVGLQLGEEGRLDVVHGCRGHGSLLSVKGGTIDVMKRLIAALVVCLVFASGCADVELRLPWAAKKYDPLRTATCGAEFAGE